MRISLKLRQWLLHRIVIRTLDTREPDVTIGEETPYLRRWFVIPRNKWFNIYFHNMKRSDDDRALHDHPWINVSVMLRGEYDEVVPVMDHEPWGPTMTIRRQEGDVVFRRSGKMAHRLMLVDDREVWTLFITGPNVRSWGFWCPGGRWVHWKVFTKPVGNSKSGGIGAGCGEDDRIGSEAGSPAGAAQTDLPPSRRYRGWDDRRGRFPWQSVL